MLPVEVQDAQDQVRVLHDQEATYLQRLLRRATRHCENITRRAFITQTWVLTLDGWDDPRYATCRVIYVPRPPLISVTSIAYLDSNGDSQTLSSANYRVDTQSQPGRIEEAYSATWPTTRGVIGDVTITHTAGYGASGASVPDDIQHAVLIMAAAMHEHREGEFETPRAVLDLLDPYVMETYA